MYDKVEGGQYGVGCVYDKVEGVNMVLGVCMIR